MMKNYKLLTWFAVYFVTILLISNIVSTKIVNWWWFVRDGGTLLFPLSYIIGDILTEVYGYAASRRVIWMWLWAQILMWLVVIWIWAMPADASRTFQEAYMQVLWFTPRIILASVIAYAVWEFTNSYILAKLKIMMQWSKLWVRTISSTLVGQWLDTIIFIVIAFWWVFDTSTIIALIVSNYILKVSIEIIFTPLTYRAVRKVKQIEHEDYYDTDTDFNPLKLG